MCSPDPAARFAAWLREQIAAGSPPLEVWMVSVHVRGRFRPIRELVGEPDGLRDVEREIIAVVKAAGGPLRSKEVAARLRVAYDGNIRGLLRDLILKGHIEHCPGGYRMPGPAQRSVTITNTNAPSAPAEMKS